MARKPARLREDKQKLVRTAVRRACREIVCRVEPLEERRMLASTPFYGTPFALPTTIQAEDFDNGGQGVAYYDATAPNQGGQYRTTERVDIEKTTDTGGGYDISYIIPGEWENYTVNVPSSGAYNFAFRLSSPGGGSFHVNVDGQNATGAITIPSTGGYQNWTTVSKTNVNLPAGQHVLTVWWDSTGTASPYPANFNWMQIAAAPPPLPTVSIAATDPNAAEQNNDPGVFTVSRTGSTSNALTVPLVLGGTATNGSDYNSLASSVTIPAGQSSAQVVVTPIDDNLVEGNETVVASLGSSSAYTTGSPSSATVTIADNDTATTLPVVTIVASDPNAAEQGSDPGVFTVSRTGSTTSALTVPISLSGTATNGSDYSSLPSSVTIPAGQASVQLVVTPIDDSLVEGNETVVATLGSSSAFSPGSPSNATVTIADNDAVTPPPGSPTPYTGSPYAVPGQIEMENFDLGGEGVAYHDSDPSNDGSAYRLSEGVDIQATSDAGGGYNIGWTQTGEWMGYTVNVANTGSYNLDVRAANLGAGGAFHVEVDGTNVTGTLSVPDTGSFSTFTDVLKNGISLTAGKHFVKVVMDGNSQYGFSGNFNWMKFSTVAAPPPPPPPGTPSPFGGTPWSIAGQIEAENFDIGGEGVAYHDTTPANEGNSYRSSEAVDVEPVADTGGGYDVGYIHAGEWLGYTVKVNSAGNYDFDARVADVGAGASFHVEVDGTNVTGSVAVPDTGAFSKYVDVVKTNIPLSAGQHFLKIVYDTNAPSAFAGNLNWFKFTASAVTPPPPQSTPFSGTPATVPGSIEAENYDLGGEGVAYHDSDPANNGKAYRPNDGVDIEATTDTGGGYDVGYVKAGEWLNYTINVPTAGTYKLVSRVADVGTGGTFHVTFGNTSTGPIVIPDTGAWQAFTDVTTNNIQLAAGTYIMKVSMDANGVNGFVGNFNRFTLSATTVGTTGSQPDLKIRNYGETAYTGSGVINTTGVNQIKGQDQPFFPSIFQVEVTNTGTKADSFNITGPASSSPNWRIWYYDSQVQGGHVGGGQYTTDQVTGSGWNTGILQPGESKDFRFEVGASPLAPADDQYTVQLTANSASDATKSDVVIGKAFNDPRWELEVRRRNYAQVTGESGTYLLDLQNYGNIADQYTIKATGSGTGYTVKYFDAYSGGNDITAQVVAGTYTTSPIGFHSIQNIAVQITSTDGQAHSVQFTATSTGKSSVSQTVTISNVAPLAPSTSFFPIGVWDQPAGNFDTWKQRGINTVVQYDSYGGTQSVAYWSQIALDKGLSMIRQPDSNPSTDQWSNLLAWMQPDEPELNGDPPANALANYNALKAANPNIPIYTNFDASDFVGWQQDVSAATYQQYIAATDWVSGGMYPISGWNRPDDLDVMGRAVDRMESLAQGAPTYAIIESSNQMGPWLPANTPGPNATQVRAEVWDSIVHGARGIIYFPQQLSDTAGFSYDNTPPDVAAEMTRIDAQITSIGAALESPLDPPTLGVTANSPLEATWRSYGGHNYYIVFNYSNQATTQQITLQGVNSATIATVQGESRSVALSSGAFSDTFAPYQAHIYVV